MLEVITLWHNHCIPSLYWFNSLERMYSYSHITLSQNGLSLHRLPLH